MLRIEPVSRAEEWNPLVASLPITSALQSWGWGEVKRLSGWQPERLALYEGDTLVAAVQLFRRRFWGPFSMLYAPRGPALRRVEDLPKVAQALRRVAQGAAYLKLEPETGQPASEPAPVFPGLRPSETIQPEYSVWLELGLGREGLLAQMEGMHRRNTRLAEKRVVASIEGEEAFEEFWALFEETNRRARLRQHAKAYYQAVLREMNQPLGRAFISIARLEGKALAAGLFVAFAGRVDYLYGGSSRKNTNAKAPNGMHWRAILWGVEHGYHTYDLWGVPRKREGSHAAGIDSFKEGFGGRRVRFPAYDLPLSPLYVPLTKALRLRKSWINYRTRGTPRDVL
ncbi:Aminoacyltransferase FemB [Meiothermus luteus]|uniref:Aminoacyltransferase FemB n=1 Tax=Meiothermus luteus TaxID=2026184 RepID=A0A399ERP9_9DEIN|nr:peptidoglycan bridge formation glycyltransferase FemA/FemB family protein [Meiothermus luteus]RIH84861.1 Aminoacyltransferase FemB [Meiothermus luteus]RMH55589.1 MAG: peptidoglycan bridge formation glycyltransferase FemA/FemB family protein [Deinococcota bacterium]